VAPEPPQVAFRVAARVAAAAVTLVGDVLDDGCARGGRPRVVGVDVTHDHAGALRFAQAGFLRLHDLAAPFAVVAGRAEHDHAVAEGELGMVHGIAIGVDGVPVEAEGAAQPVDRGGRVAVAQAGNDGAGGVGGVAHR